MERKIKLIEYIGVIIGIIGLFYLACGGLANIAIWLIGKMLAPYLGTHA